MVNDSILNPPEPLFCPPNFWLTPLWTCFDWLPFSCLVLLSHPDKDSPSLLQLGSSFGHHYHSLWYCINKCDCWDLGIHLHPQRSNGDKIQAVIQLDSLWTSQQLFSLHDLQKSGRITMFIIYTTMSYWDAWIEQSYLLLIKPVLFPESGETVCCEKCALCLTFMAYCLT